LAVSKRLWKAHARHGCRLSAMTGLLLLFCSAAMAGSSGQLRLGGHVSPKATVHLSNWSPAFLRLQSATNPLVPLTEIALSANNRRFAVNLVSRNAGQAGDPRLIDSATGASIAYRVLYGGEKITFVEGAGIFAGSSMPSATAKPLELDLSLVKGRQDGSFQDRLYLVVTAK